MADEEKGKPKEVKRRRGNTLENWEVAIVKAMINGGSPFTNDQDILAYFTRPTRSVNHRLIGEIRNEAKHRAIKPASDEDVDAFLATWPDIDHEPDLDGGIRTLIAELRGKNPPEDLWKWKAGRHEAGFLTFGQAETNKLIAGRLEQLLKAEG